MLKPENPHSITPDGTILLSDTEDSCDWKPLEIALSSLGATPIFNHEVSSMDGFDLEVDEVQEPNSPCPETTTACRRQRPTRWLKCPHCPYYRTRLCSQLEAHKNLCFRLRWHKCSMCLFKTISANVIRRHFILGHTYKNKLRLQCKHCKFSAQSLKKLELHQRAYHRCAFCVCDGVTYAPPTRHESHIDLNIDDSYFYCKQCLYHSRNEKHFKAHERVAHGKELKAGVCGDDYENMGMVLITPKKNGEKGKGEMYFCNLCSYKFTSSSGYIRHAKNHPIYMGVKPVQNKTPKKRYKKKNIEDKPRPEPRPVVEHKCTNCAFKSIDETQLFIHQFSKVCFRLNRSNGYQIQSNNF